MLEEVPSLKDTAWLAQRLGLSVSTIERLRSKGSSTLPPHLMIGNSIRYDERVVEQFLAGYSQSKSKCEVCDD